MTKKLRVRFWVEAASACVSAFLFAFTLASRDWIEPVFGVVPDHHSGSLEWTIVSVSLVATFVLGLLARAEWRRPVMGT